jgi:hypothetical protein
VVKELLGPQEGPSFMEIINYFLLHITVVCLPPLLYIGEVLLRRIMAIDKL